MIKKRLIALLADAKKYIVYNVLWQWGALLCSIVMMFAAGRLLEACAVPHFGSALFQTLECFVPLILLSILLRAFCSRRAADAAFLAGCDVKKELRRRLYQKLSSMGANYHEKVPTAEAVQVAVEGVEQLEVYFGKYLPQLFYSLLAPLTLFLVLSRISLRASLVLLVCVPLIPLTIMAVQKLASRLLKKYWSIYTSLGDHFLEDLQGLSTLKIYQADGAKAKEMDEEAERFRKITMKVLMMQLNSIIAMDIVAYGGAAAGMICTLREFAAGRIVLSGAFTIILLASEFFIPMRLLGSYFHIAMNGMSASDKLFAILDLPEEEKGTKTLPDGPLSVAFRDVAFSYDGKRQVLSDISLTIPKTGIVSLVGLSGCGKSTVVSLLCGEHRDYSGKILLNEEDETELREISEESLLRSITRVSHNSYLFRGSVADTLRLAAPGADDAALWEALEKVRLADYVRAQGGLSMQIEERGENLSGGQRQRLALARALLHRSPLYILDEAASNIDVESEEQIMEVVRELSKTHAVLLISHRLANVVASGCIYYLEGGRITERGTHETLLRKNGAYAKLFREQEALEHYTAERRKA